MFSQYATDVQWLCKNNQYHNNIQNTIQLKMGATSETGTAYSSGAPELTPFLVGWVLLDLQFYVCFVDRCFSFCPFSFGHCVVYPSSIRARVAQWVRQLDYLATHTSLSPMRRGFAPGFVNYKKGALNSQPQVIKLTSCLPMVGGPLRVLRLLPPLKLVAMIQLKYLLEVALSTINQIKSNQPSSIYGF